MEGKRAEEAELAEDAVVRGSAGCVGQVEDVDEGIEVDGGPEIGAAGEGHVVISQESFFPGFFTDLEQQRRVAVIGRLGGFAWEVYSRLLGVD